MSDLLPKSKSHFSRREYWDQFFNRRKDSFEWYAEYDQLKHIIHRYVKQKDSILVIGCGNSSLSADMYDIGFKDNISIDLSEIVIKQMTDRYNKNGERNGLRFQTMNVFDMKFIDESFHVIIDKGTLDAIASDDSQSSIVRMDQMFGQISRVLKTYGRYICVSLLQSHILKELLKWFSENGNWFIRIQRCNRAEDVTQHQSNQDSLVLPVFVVICTKFQSLTSNDSKTVSKLNNNFYEIISSDDNINDKPKRMNTSDEVMLEIESLQEFAFIQHYIKNVKISADDDIHLDLFDANDSVNPRYTLYFSNYVNKKSKPSSSCGVFIVPQGRELEWLFGTTEGRVELTKQSNCQKLIVIHLNRNHKYSNIDQIKNELSVKVLELLPKSIINTNSQIPYLSIGDEVGKRNVVFEGKSEFSGHFVIEEVINNGENYRRLIFLNSKNIIQSEAKLKINKKGKKKNLIIDHNYLSCNHHEVITAGLTFLSNDYANYNMLVIGLGGGCLPTFILNNIKSKIDIKIKVIEIDKSMMNIAVQWFDFKTITNSNNVKIDIEIEDGLKYISSLNPGSDSFDYIVFDVDSKDPNLGLSCPPLPFVEMDLITKVRDILIDRNGVFVLNLVARNVVIRNQVYNTIKTVFESCYVFSIKQELNEILFAFSTKVRPQWFGYESVVQKINDLSKNQFYIPLLKESYFDLSGNHLKML